MRAFLFEILCLRRQARKAGAACTYNTLMFPAPSKTPSGNAPKEFAARCLPNSKHQIILMALGENNPTLLAITGVFEQYSQETYIDTSEDSGRQ